jgi:PIN domain nuclease of toxin-antitoxin system
MNVLLDTHALLVAQALEDGPPVVGDDAAFDAYGVTRLW